MERLTLSTPVQVKFVGNSNTKAIVYIGVMKAARRVNLRGADGRPECECGAYDCDKEPCACMLCVAREAGYQWNRLLSDDDTVQRWKGQYSDLPEFNVPGTDQLRYLKYDKFLCKPVAFPIPRGRPRTHRIKKATAAYKRMRQFNESAAEGRAEDRSDTGSRTDDFESVSEEGSGREEFAEEDD